MEKGSMTTVVGNKLQSEAQLFTVGLSRVRVEHDWSVIYISIGGVQTQLNNNFNDNKVRHCKTDGVFAAHRI